MPVEKALYKLLFIIFILKIEPVEQAMEFCNKSAWLTKH